MQNLTKHDFFSKIDSELKAYLLGFLYADGCVYQRIRKDGKHIEKGVKLNVEKSDFYIINLLNQIVPHRNPLTVKYKIMKVKDKEYQCKDQLSLTIYSHQIFSDLEKLGCFYQKTKKDLHLPNIPKKLIRHFVRGLFDGDGTCQLDIVKRKDRPIGTAIKRTFHIISYAKNLFEEIKDFVKENYNIELKIYTTKGKYWQLKCNSIDNFKKMYNLFYKDSEFFFERKRVKFYECSMLTPSKIREIKSLNLRNA